MAAYCADPPKVVADMTIGASDPIPAALARTANEAAKVDPATAKGTIALAPARKLSPSVSLYAGSSHSTWSK